MFLKQLEHMLNEWVYGWISLHHFILHCDWKERLLIGSIVWYLREIKLWMERNMLKLNDDETEFIVFKYKHNNNLFAGVNVQVNIKICHCSYCTVCQIRFVVNLRSCKYWSAPNLKIWRYICLSPRLRHNIGSYYN